MPHTLRILQIVPGTSVDGPGLRTSIYLAGCSHHCPECHNPASWDFNAGTEMSVTEIAAIVIAHGFNVTLTGGDPLQQPVEAISELADILRDEGLRIWCYTGYTYEELQQMHRLAELLQKFEAIVEGPYIDAQRDITLRFRGSSNQRILRPDGSPFPLSETTLNTF